ncbi:MAG: phosphoribosylglycinamide formyltransferase [Desulfarculaceae bacterium]|nr:phosphoribosylglycinamide formyltransferase [Desulfarculaceae bacterium]
MADKIRVGALISGGGTNLQAIIDACTNRTIDADLVFTGSDKPEAGGLERAQKAGIDTFFVDYRPVIKQAKESLDRLDIPGDFNFEEIRQKQKLLGPDTPADRVRTFLVSRAVAESRLLDAIRPYQIDLLVLAGFMRTLTPYFIDRFHEGENTHRIMNIHPALLPSFPGTDGYGDTYRYGCKVGGCTVHYIDYGEDTGPIIGQKAFEIKDGDTLEDVKKRGLELEWQLYPECIRKFAETVGKRKIS